MKRRAFFLALLALSLGGCGFHLRGDVALPFKTLYIDAPGYNQMQVDSFYQRLVRRLQVGGAVLVSSPAQAQVVLKILPEKRTRTILALTSAGQVAEYRIALALSYAVLGPDGRAIAAPQTINLTRDYTYNANQYLAMGAEENLLYRDMEDAALDQIAQRLQDIKP